jgi:hypothetical protein
MADTIKFKLWDKHIMHGPFDVHEMILNKQTVDINIKECDIIRWSGLQDENGNDIYDGDLIDAHELSTKPLLIVYGFGRYKAINRNFKAYLDDVFTRCKVIGNIMENPSKAKY